MDMRTLATTAVLASLLLAGCSGGSGGPGTDDQPIDGIDDLDLKATETTGVIRGVVFDDSVTPLANVDISVPVEGVNRTAQTNDKGLFGFDGLTPGEYFVTASKAGYTTTQQLVKVEAGVDDPPATRILLEFNAALRPYADQLVYEAYIGCSLTLPVVSVAACDIGPLKELTNNQFLVNYDATRPPSWIQSEAVWDSTNPVGDDLSLSLTDFSDGPQRTVTQVRGKSPIHFTVNETVAAQYNYGVNNSLVIRLFSTSTEGTDVAPDQQVQDAYAANGYGVVNATGLPGVTGTAADAANGVLGIVGADVVGNPFGSEDCIKHAVLFDSCLGVGGLGVVIQQRVTVYTHIFYGYTPPEGWTFSAAQSVPQPE